MKRLQLIFSTTIKKIFKITEKNKIVVLIFLFGVLLRAYHLGYKPLWYDEAATFLFGTLNLHKILEDPEFLILGSNSLGLWLIIKPILYLGSSELLLRLPVFLAGIASIFVFFKFAKLILPEKIALFVTFLFSIHPVHIWDSQNARIYSIWLFIQLWSSLLIFKKNDQNINLWFFLTTLSIYFHIYSIFLLIFQLIYLYFNKKSLKIIPLIILFIFSLPQFYIIKFGLPTQSIAENIGMGFVWYKGIFANISMIAGSPPEIFEHNKAFILFQNYFVKIFTICFFVIFIVSLFTGIYNDFLTDEIMKKSFCYILLFFLTFLPIVHDFINIPFYPRYNIFLLPLGLILVGMGIMKLKNILLKTIITIMISSFFLYSDLEILNKSVSQPRPFAKKELEYIANYDSEIVVSSVYYSLNLVYYRGRDNRYVIVIPERFTKFHREVVEMFKYFTSGNYFSTRNNCLELKKYLDSKEKFLVLLIPTPKYILEDNCDAVLFSYISFSTKFINTPFGIIFEVKK